MEVFHAQTQLKEHLESIISSKKTIGFVPTMGAIHQGHLSLLQQALNQNDIVVVSIFVNPTQFNNQQDLDKYPRTLERDVALIKMLSDNIIVYAPTVDDIYNGTTIAQKFEYDGLESEMEGANRPGHFDGVGTIVKMLFEIIKPTNAYFGEKDFQQLQIVRKMVQKNNLDVNVVGCPIFREESGLAMSSRNERLSEKAKQKATYIYKVLQEAKDVFQKSDVKQTVDYVTAAFKKETDFTLEYFVVANEDNLQTVHQKETDKKYRAFIVAHIEEVRLIDNIALN